MVKKKKGNQERDKEKRGCEKAKTCEQMNSTRMSFLFNRNLNKTEKNLWRGKKQARTITNVREGGRNSKTVRRRQKREHR